MDVRPISNDEDHRAALEEIETLWRAEEGTQEGEQLDQLISRVIAYEEARWPDRSDRKASARLAARRLAALGGSDPGAMAAPRRRFW